MKRASALLLLILLSACGGGDPEDVEDERKTIVPVECTEDPKVCTSIIR